MNWKSIFKIFAISAGVVLIVLAGLMFWGLSMLPSAFQIKQSITPPALKGARSVVAPSADGEAAVITEENLPAKIETEQETLNKAALKVIKEDFSDQRRPLVDACRSLDKAATSEFLKDSKNASGKYFIHSLSQDEKDPLSETAAPIMRSAFRAPGMDQVVDMITKSDEEHDPGVLKKAEFYYEMYKAGSYLKAHVADLNRVLQQSYNLHNLMKAVAKKPELAKMPAVMSFCEDMEKNLNAEGDFDADASAKEMQSFLDQNGIKAVDINFDPNYRSKIVLNISNTQLNMNDAWIAQVFAADIEKAMTEKKTK